MLIKVCIRNQSKNAHQGVYQKTIQKMLIKVCIRNQSKNAHQGVYAKLWLFWGCGANPCGIAMQGQPIIISGDVGRILAVLQCKANP